MVQAQKTKDYRLFGENGDGKTIKCRFIAKNDRDALRIARRTVNERVETILARLVEIVKKGEYRDVPIEA